MKGATVSELLDLEHTVASELLGSVTYPFEALPKIGDFIKKLSSSLDSERFTEIAEGVFAAKSAKIAASALIIGPAVIDEGAEIRHCAFIRGNVLVGKNCVVGNSCEIKNSILFDNVQVPHYNYVGDSVLGYKSHMGAGSITSNVKSDKTQVCIKSGGQSLDTGLKKVGAVLGDFVEVGCGSVLNPGTVIGRNTNIYPLSSVRGVIPPDSIYKKQGEIAEKR